MPTHDAAAFIAYSAGRSKIAVNWVVGDRANAAMGRKYLPRSLAAAGKGRPLNALVGQVMKLSQGRANPQQVTDLLKQKITD